MARNDDAIRLEDSLTANDFAALRNAPELADLYGLAHKLRATAPDAAPDPLFLEGLRAALPKAHPANGHAAAPAPLRYASFPTPLGLLHVAFAGNTVRSTDLGVTDELFERECLARFHEMPQRAAACPPALQRRILQAVDRGRYQGAVDLASLPEFQQRVLRKTLEIRRGEVRSYRWIAHEIGAPKAVRAVGTALARNPIPILIPCHRVVRSDYHIGEYGCGGPTKKREILRHEGVDVDRLEQLARQGVRYLGSRTTHIYCMPGCYTGRRVKLEYEVPFPSEQAARAAGYRPCKVCRPA